MKAYIFLAEGFEEIEAITPIDILRRADIETITVSVSDNKLVTGGRNITLIADCLFAEISIENTDYIILPGGMPGTDNLMAHEGLNKVIKNNILICTTHFNTCSGNYINNNLFVSSSVDFTGNSSNNNYLHIVYNT